MRRTLAFVSLAFLVASCGGDGTSPFATTSAASTTAPPTSSTASTTSTAAATTAVTTTTTSATHVWADRLVGTGIWGEWETGGEVRRLRGDGVGDEVMWLHMTLCLGTTGDVCFWRLVFAARPTDPPDALEAGYDGFIGLARRRGGPDPEILEVVAAVDVALPPAAGTAVVLAGGDEGPYWAVELGFSAAGLVVQRAWRPDLAGAALVPVDPVVEGLPDVSLWPDTGPVVGRVVTARDYFAAPDDPSRSLDLSGAAPVVIPGFLEAGGSLLPGGVGLGWEATAAEEPARVVWLQQLLGWSYTGSALWRVRDAVEFGAVAGASSGYSCRHEASNSDAVALVTGSDCDACPVASAEAYRVDRTLWELVAVPPGEVLCTCECGG